jgi:hypothetical protein
MSAKNNAPWHRAWPLARSCGNDVTLRAHYTDVNPNTVDNPSLTVEFRAIRLNIARTLGEEWRGVL